MRTTTKNSKRLIAFSATAIMALGLTLPGAVRANAYTVDEAAEFTKEVRTPDSLAPMTRQGFRSEAGIVDPNFQDASVSVTPAISMVVRGLSLIRTKSAGPTPLQTIRLRRR